MESSAVSANLRHIVKFEAKPYPKEQEATAVTQGFGNVAFLKLVSQLSSPDVVIQQKALLGLSDFLRVPIPWVECINAGVTAPLTKLLEHEDTLVRQRTAAALRLVAIKELGCKHMIRDDTFPAVVRSLTDAELSIRDASYRCLLNASKFQCTNECLVAAKTTLTTLMKLVLEEEQSRAVLGLRILTQIAEMHRNEEAVSQLVDDCDALPSLTRLLIAGQDCQIQQGAAALINVLATRPDAKVKCVKEGTVGHLLRILADNRIPVNVAALSALGNITIVNEGKQEVVKLGGVQALVDKLFVGNETIRSHLLECLTNIAEEPEGRQELINYGGLGLLKDMGQAEQTAATKKKLAHAVRQTEFRHWPYNWLPSI